MNGEDHMMPRPVEELGRVVVEDVRDAHLDEMMRVVDGTIGKELYERLHAAGFTGEQKNVLMKFVLASTDTVLGRLAFLVGELIAEGKLEVRARAEGGKSPPLDGFDPLHVWYEDLVAKYGKIRDVW